MLHILINHSPDLKKLRDEGYDLEVRSGHLLVKDVRYVNSHKKVARGVLGAPGESARHQRIVSSRPGGSGGVAQRGADGDLLAELSQVDVSGCIRLTRLTTDAAQPSNRRR